jgi:uncharacterized coiled-coil protein SlyX
MTDDAIVDLQTRLSHQQVEIDELTQHSLQQAQTIKALLKVVEELQAQMRVIAEKVEQGEIVDAPPPHY